MNDLDRLMARLESVEDKLDLLLAKDSEPVVIQLDSNVDPGFTVTLTPGEKTWFNLPVYLEVENE